MAVLPKDLDSYVILPLPSRRRNKAPSRAHPRERCAKHKSDTVEGTKPLRRHIHRSGFLRYPAASHVCRRHKAPSRARRGTRPCGRRSRATRQRNQAPLRAHPQAVNRIRSKEGSPFAGISDSEPFESKARSPFAGVVARPYPPTLPAAGRSKAQSPFAGILRS